MAPPHSNDHHLFPRAPRSQLLSAYGRKDLTRWWRHPHRLAGFALPLILVPPVIGWFTVGPQFTPDLLLLWVTLPAILGLILVAVKMAPPLVVANLAVLLSLWLACEGGFALFHRFFPERDPYPPANLPHVEYRPELFRPDPDLGWWYEPDVTTKATATRDGRSVYRTRIGINRQGWRRTPPATGSLQRERFVALFGDSFVFGTGLDDDQTLAYHLSRVQDGAQVYNFGLMGGGPHQALVALRTKRLETVVRERRGVALFLWNDFHMDRLLGSVELHLAYAHHAPYFALNGAGALIQHGNFTTGRPLRALLFPLIGRSHVLRHFGLHGAAPYAASDYRLAAAMLDAFCREFVARFDSEGCYIVAYPGAHEAPRRLFPRLTESPAQVRDLSQVLAGTEGNLFIADDGHPTERTNQILAQRLGEELGLIRDAATSRRQNARVASFGRNPGTQQRWSGW